MKQKIKICLAQDKLHISEWSQSEVGQYHILWWERGMCILLYLGTTIDVGLDQWSNTADAVIYERCMWMCLL